MLPANIETAYAEAGKIINWNIYATLATASSEGAPHISPVYFSFDSELRIFWASALDALHSKLIHTNPSISLVIFNSTAPEREGNGVYMRGMAKEYHGSDLTAVIAAHSNRVNKVPTKTDQDYLGDSPRRIFCFTPTNAWTLLQPRDVAGHLIDTKVELDLVKLKEELNICQ